MPTITEFSAIPGVLLVELRPFADERGRFTETFRKEWFPQRAWSNVQSNRSDSRAGVLRGLHYHFHQVDYWYLAAGRIRVGLADLRRSFFAGLPLRPELPARADEFLHHLVALQQICLARFAFRQR